MNLRSGRETMALPDKVRALDKVRAQLRLIESKKRKIQGQLPGGYRTIDELQCEDERLSSLINEYSDLRRSNSREMDFALESQHILQTKLQHLQRAIRMYVLLPNLCA
jgi:chromosome segregation ATPase